MSILHCNWKNKDESGTQRDAIFNFRCTEIEKGMRFLTQFHLPSEQRTASVGVGAGASVSVLVLGIENVDD